MPFDALTVAAVRQELEQKVVGGRVQGIVVPAPLTVALEVYRAGVGRTYLLLSAHPQNARVHLLPAGASRDPEQRPPLLLLLRKYVRGGTITSVSQPPHERILGLSIVKRLVPDKHQEYHSDPYFMDNGEADAESERENDEGGPDVPPTTVELVAEIMGKLSNIVLVAEDGTVMDSIKRIPSSINRYRVVLPNRPYVAPPPQDKRDPFRTSVNALSVDLQKTIDNDPKALAWKGLVSAFVGVSPPLAREAIYRALDKADVPAREIARDPAVLEAIMKQLTALLSLEHTGEWEHTVASMEGEEGRKALDFAPYALRHLEAQGAKLERYGSISEAAVAYFAQSQAFTGHPAVRQAIQAQLEELKNRDNRRLSSLREQITKAEAAEELRRKGESIFAYMHTLTPGQTTLVIAEEKLTIKLDPGMSPVENAQALFKEYHKARSAQEDLPELIAQAEMRIQLLDELQTSLDLARTYDELKSMQGELDLAKYPAGRQPGQEQSDGGKQGKKKQKKGSEKLPQPLRLKTAGGIPMLVGRTARQNEAVTFLLAAPEDLWFHARNVPGSHVILKTTAGDATEDDIVEAAQTAAAYSKARENGQVDVIYTERRYVRKVPNGPPGFVNYRNEQTLRVAPRKLERPGKQA